MEPPPLIAASSGGVDVSSAPSSPSSASAQQEPFHFPADSVRAYSESVGLALGEDAAKEVSDEVTFRLRKLIQDSEQFMFHAKRSKMHCEDLDFALRMEGQEPLYGVNAGPEHIPFRYASGGGRELHFVEEKEVDLGDLTNAPLPKIPMGISLRAHWMAIDGTQPSIPENPPAQSKDQLQSETSNPLVKLKTADAKDNKLSQVLQSKPTKLKNMETVNVKQLATHELSVEQQLYYTEITKACVGSDEGRRAEALQSLASDPGLHQMLPGLCTFIREGVRINVVQHQLAILIYLMRMVKSLLENQSLFMEKYLHELIPAVATCIVSQQLCTRPDVDYHWALRDFASRLMANICKNFNTSTNSLQTRITRVFSEAMKDEKGPLVSYYGAIAGLQELGPEVVKVFILPHIAAISARIDAATDPALVAAGSTVGNIENTAAKHIRNLIVKSVTPVIISSRPAPDLLEEYKADYGSLGSYLHAAVVKSRTPPPPAHQTLLGAPASAPSTPSTPQARSALVGQTPPGTPSAGQQRVYVLGAQQQPVHVVATTSAGTPQRVMQLQTAAPSTPTTPQPQQPHQIYLQPHKP